MASLVSIKHIGPKKYTHTVDARTFSDVWYLKVAERNADPIDVEALAMLSVPSTWATFPSARLSSLTCNQLGEDTHGWEVEAEYSTKAEGDESNPLDENPLNKPVTVDVNFQPYERVVDVDIYGNPIASTAGEPYDDVTVDDGRWQIKLSWNTATFPLDLADDLKRTVNSDYYLGRSPGTLKIVGMSGQSQRATITNPQTNQQEELSYYQTEVVFDYDQDTWKKKIANRGFYKLNGSGEQERIRDAEGEPIETPAFISEDGTTVLQPGDPPFIQEFEVLTQVSYGGLFPEP